MIYSKNICPLCNTSLTVQIENEIPIRYYCNNVIIYSETPKSMEYFITHYENFLLNGGICTMFFLPYIVEHFKHTSKTIIYKMDMPYSPYDNEKTILELNQLLDWDWSQPYDVVRRIKILTTFS